MVPGTEVSTGGASVPWWRSGAGPRARRRGAAGVDGGWSFRAPVADMSTYLPWLAARVEALGGTIARLDLGALPSATAVVVLEQFGLDRWWLDPAGPVSRSAGGSRRRSRATSAVRSRCPTPGSESRPRRRRCSVEVQSEVGVGTVVRVAVPHPL